MEKSNTTMRVRLTEVEHPRLGGILGARKITLRQAQGKPLNSADRYKSASSAFHLFMVATYPLERVKSVRSLPLRGKNHPILQNGK